MSKLNLKRMNLFGEINDIRQFIKDHLEMLIETDANIIWMDDQEVCDYLRVSSSTLSRFREKGNIYYTRVGQRLFYIRQSIDYVLIKAGMTLD